MTPTEKLFLSEAETNFKLGAKQMKFTLLVADRKINALAAAFGLGHPDKVFISRVEQEIETPEISLDAYFMRVIELSRKEKDYWIPGVLYRGQLYCAEDVNQLSDGNKIMVRKGKVRSNGNK